MNKLWRSTEEWIKAENKKRITLYTYKRDVRRMAATVIN